MRRNNGKIVNPIDTEKQYTPVHKQKHRDNGVVVVYLPGVDMAPFPQLGKDPSWLFRLWKFVYGDKVYQLKVIRGELALVKVDPAIEEKPWDNPKKYKVMLCLPDDRTFLCAGDTEEELHQDIQAKVAEYQIQQILFGFGWVGTRPFPQGWANMQIKNAMEGPKAKFGEPSREE